PGHVESAFGGDFLTPFGNQADLVRMKLERQLDHFIGGRKLLVEPNVDFLAQPAEIVVLDMTTVFAQMKCDRLRPGALRGQCRFDRIGVIDPARLAQRSDMIDINAEARHVQPLACPARLPIAAAISLARVPISAKSSPSIITRATISVPE